MSFTSVNTSLFPSVTYTLPSKQLANLLPQKTNNESKEWTQAQKEVEDRVRSAIQRVNYYQWQNQKLELVAGKSGVTHNSASVTTTAVDTATTATRRDKISIKRHTRRTPGTCACFLLSLRVLVKEKTFTKNTKKKRRRNTDKYDDKNVSKIKPKDQISYNTFMSMIDNHARPFQEENHQFLVNKIAEAEDPKAYEIPPLGKHWENAQEGDQACPSEDVVDLEDLGLDNISHGPLTNRLFSALMTEATDFDISKLGNCKDKEFNENQGESERIIPSNQNILDERLKLELQYVGLLDKDEDLSLLFVIERVGTIENINEVSSFSSTTQNEKGDEVKDRLIELQESLKVQSKINVNRISKIMPKLQRHIAYNQFTAFIDQLDKQIEEGYAARYNLTKTTKKKKPINSQNLESNITRRQKYMGQIGRLFKPEEFMVPNKSIFDDDETLLSS
ncbi:11402_t:CDS:2 [Ambispora leptoticha]|uniref:11402_t:CDS:1 n=1 Tax=Ambispora leptoticha TaxID=144679 RepID=A0A9N9ANT0_9GLOM|nr:11402_t:CDS:2 [Ambispora leptoticha]